MLTDNILLDDARVLSLSGDLASASSSSTTTPPASPGLVSEPPFAAPFWAKMSQTGPGSALPTLNNNNTTKKRKKSDAKPLSQLNKCLNEKRRREQENVYIEELAELISASIADMNSLSVKPDKCAILQETVNQIRRIKEEDGRSSDDVQQGEVSSSKPALLEGQVLSAFLLEALDGFLFVVNTEGKVEYVSANVSQFLHYSPEDLVGKSIYNIIHLGDHARFSSSLLPTSIGWPASEQANQATSRSRVFNCRFLVQPPDEQDETIEEKQQRVSQYENLQISAVLNPYPGEKSDNPESPESGEAQNCLICVARRIPVSEKTPTLTGGPTVEQFTTRLDLSGRITAVDTSGVSATYSQYLNKDLVGCIIQELCHPLDLPKLCAHLKEALQTGQSTSPLYRLRVTPLSEAEREGRGTPVEPAHCTYVRVQTKTKRFPFNPVTHEMEFLMAAHSIIGDQEVISDHESPGSSSSNPHSLRPGSTLASPTPVTSLAHHPVAPPTSSATSMPVPPPPPASGGNPLLTSVVRNLPSAAELTPSSLPSLETTAGTGFAPFTLNSTDLSLNDFSLDLFPSSTWDLIPNDNSLDDPTATSPSSHGMTLNINPTPPTPAQAAAASAVTGTSNVAAPVLNHNHHGGSTSNLHHVAWASPPPRPASTSNNSYVVSRPSSRQSMSAASTPRPPSGYSPVPILAPISPAAPQPPSNNPPAQPSPSPFSNNFPFSPLQEHSATPTMLGAGSAGTGLGPVEDSKEGILNMTSPASAAAAAAAADSGRLRNLLTQRPAASSNSMVHSALLQSLGLAEDGESLVAVKKEKEEKGHDHKILKGLLNQDDDDERARRNSGDVKPGGNNMLLKLLNVRNDDDDLEQQNGFRKQNELLQQLLKDQDVDRRTSSQHNSDNEQDSLLLKSLGFPATPNSNSQASNHHGPRPNTPLTLGGLGPAATRSPASAHTADALGLSMAELQAGSLFRGAKRPSDEGMDTFRPSKQPLLDPSPSNSTGNTVLNQLLGAPTNNGIMPVATTAQAVSVALAPTINAPTPTSGGGASTLCQRNRMLASLLARQPSAVPSPTTLASPKPSALPQEKLPKDLKEKIMQAPLGPQPAALWGGSLVQSSAPNVSNNSVATTTANSDGLNRHPALLQATLNRSGPSAPGGNGFLNSLLNRPPQEAANDVNVNLNTINQRPLPPSHQQQQQRLQQQQQATSTGQKVVISGQQLSVSANINPSGGLNISLSNSSLSMGLEANASVPNNRRMLVGNNANAPKSFQDVFTTEMGLAVADSLSAAGLGWDMQSTDPLLSDILDQVIEMDRNYDPPIADDTLMTILEGLRSPPPPSPVTPVPPVQPAPSFPVDMNEKLAINAITKSLMSFESVAPGPAAQSTLPQNNFGTPRPQPPHYAANQGPQSVSQAVVNQQAAIQRRQKLQLIQHQRRLLARQQQQQLLAVGDSAGPGPQLSPAALQHMDELLNNTVPPNMTIQRSSNLPDSQLSPSYSNVLLNSPGPTQGPPTPGQQQVSPSQDRPNVNVQPFSPLLQNNQSNVNFSPGQTRLSFSGGIPTFSSSQLSPRVPQGQPGSQFPSQLSPQSGTVGGARGSPGVPGPANTGSGPSLQGQPSPGGAWSAGNMPLSTRPQANPMLSAHLANNFPGRNFTRAPLRGPTGPRPLFNEGNASPGPTPVPPNVLNNNLYLQQQQQQQMRLQRTISAPGGSVPSGMGASHSHSRHYSMGNRDYYPPFRTPPYHSPTPYNDSHLAYRNPVPPPSYLRPMYPYTAEPCSSPLPPPPCPSPGLQAHPQPETNNHTGAMVVDSRHNHNPSSATSFVNPQNQSTAAAAASDRLRHPPPHVSTGNATMTSDYVRQELRAVVAGRTLQQSPGLGGPSQNQSPLSSGQGPGSGTNQHNNPSMPGGQSLSQADLEELGLSLELPQDVLTGEAPKGNSWDSPTFQNSPAQTNRNNMEERPRTDSKMSLLQKLLSE